VVWDNDRNAETAIRNAEEMADSKVDLAIEFQLFEHVAPVISDILSRSEIPLISLVNPHHGTVYFGSTIIARAFLPAWRWRTTRPGTGTSHVDTLLLLESTACRQNHPEQAGGRTARRSGAARTTAGESIVHLDGGRQSDLPGRGGRRVQVRSRKKVW